MLRIRSFLKSSPGFLTVVCLLGLVARLTVITLFHDRMVTSDSGGYHTLAKHLVEGRGFTYPNTFRDTDPKQDVVPTARRSPGYPLFLALVYYFCGPNLFYASLVQGVFSLLIIILCYLLGKKITNETVGRWGAGFAAFYPGLVVYSGKILVETLFTVCLLFTLLQVVNYLSTGNRKNLVLCGVMLGLTSLVKGILFPLPFLLLALCAVMKPLRSWTTPLAIVTVLMMLVLSPWIIRNYIQFHKFIPAQSSAGLELWWASSWDSMDVYLKRRDQPDWIINLSPEGAANAAMPHAIENIKTDPIQYLSVSLYRFIRFWRLPTGFQVLSSFSKFAAWTLAMVYYLVLLLALLDFRTKYRDPFTILFWFTILYLMALHSALIPYVDYRLHLPYVPVLFIFSCRYLFMKKVIS